MRRNPFSSRKPSCVSPKNMSVIFKKLRLSVLAVLLILLSGGCAQNQESFRYTYTDVFDTVTGITVFAASQEEAEQLAELLHEELLTCHRLFDIYHEYEGITNLCTVNRLAGEGAVAVDERILDLLEFALQMGDASGGKLNVCMGGLLSLWHEARTEGNEHPEQAALPDDEALRHGMEHMSPASLVLDSLVNSGCVGIFWN